MSGAAMRRWVPLLALIVYFAFPNRNYYWDGVSFAIAIERGSGLAILLHPNHLLYSVFGAGLYRAAAMAGWHVRALMAMQWANMLMAAGAAALVEKALRQAGATERASAAYALAFAFSATWWKFATDANAYVPAIFFLLCAWCLLEGGRRVAAAAAAMAMAMLFHQLAVFFVPVAMARAGWGRRAAALGAMALGPVGIAYVLACRVVKGSAAPGVLLNWITSHTPDSGFTWASGRALFLTLRGTLRLVLGGRLDALDAGVVTVVSLAAVAVGVGALCVAAAGIRGLSFGRVPAAVALWVGVYAAFLFFWMPQNTFYRLFYLPGLVMAAGVAIRAARVPARFPAIAVGALMAWNLALLVYPESEAAHNAPLACAEQMRPRWPAGTPILCERYHADLWTISYFNPQTEWWQIGPGMEDAGALDRALGEARRRGRTLWIEATAHDWLAARAGTREWLEAHEGEKLIYKDARHEFRFYGAR